MSYYSSLLNILSSWPGLGSVMTHRLLDAFLSQDYLQRTLDDLSSQIKQHPPCHSCQMPTHIHKKCQNCARESSELIVFTKIIDAMIYDYINPKSPVGLFALKNPIDHKSHHRPSDIGVNELSQLIKKKNIHSLILVTNTSLESQATYFYLEQTFSHIRVHQAQWPNPKVPSISALTTAEIARLNTNIDNILCQDLK